MFPKLFEVYLDEVWKQLDGKVIGNGTNWKTNGVGCPF